MEEREEEVSGEGLRGKEADKDAEMVTVGLREFPSEVDGDVDDSVVREIDVYFNPPTDENTQIYWMQYPLRPPSRRYDLEKCCKEVRVKPNSANAEMDIEVDVDSRSGHEDKNTKTLTLTSSEIISTKLSYAVGFLQGDKLHLNPVHAVLQLRPSTSADDGNDGDADKKQPAAASKNSGKLFASPMLSINDKELASLNMLLKSWAPLKYHSSSSDASQNCLQKLVAANHSPIPLTLNLYDCLRICPKKPTDSMGLAGPSMGSLLHLPLKERLKKWLCEGGRPAYRFSALKHLAPEVSAENLIETLTEQALLVQGHWVPKSSILQPPCIDKEALARDFLILKFIRKPTISDEELNFEEEMSLLLHENLKKLATRRVVLKDWKFNAPADPSFEKKYHSVAQQQKEQLEKDEADILTQMNKYRPQSQISLKSAGHSGTKAAVSVSTKKISMPNEKREALLKALEVLFKNHSVNSFQTICRGLRDMAVSASSLQRECDKEWMVYAANCVDGPRDELESVIREFTTSIHDVYVSKSSLTHPELNPLRDVVIQLFLAEPPNGKLKKAQIMEAFKTSINKDVSNNDYLKVMNEFCQCNGRKWKLKSPVEARIDDLHSNWSASMLENQADQ